MSEARIVNIAITPKGKARPRTRVVKTGGRSFAQIYTPKDTRRYEKAIRDAYDFEAYQHDWEPYREGVAIRLYLEFGMPIPKASSKKNREAMMAFDIVPTKKPDADNLAKAVMDAINGVAYHDDNQIASLHIMKVYAEEPYVRIYMSEFNLEGR